LIIYISNTEVMRDNEYDKLKWNKKDITNSLIQFKSNKLVMKLIADYFDINIFVLNIVEDKIYVISENNYYDIFRSNIFVVFNVDTFEPLIYSESNILEYNSGPIKKLITVDKNFIILMDADLSDHSPVQFNIRLSNINKYAKLIPKPLINESSVINVINNVNSTIIETISDNLKKETIQGKAKQDDEKENEYEEILPEESDANAYIKDIEQSETDNYLNNKLPITQLIFKISPKMKLEELQTIAKKLNIVLEKENIKKKGSTLVKTKTELIDEINIILKK